jgi:DNA-directed RNA polymerase specialized sigma subunit
VTKRKNYTIADIEYIKENHGKRPDKEIAKIIGHSYKSLQIKISRMGLSKQKMKLSEENKEIIRNFYSKLTASEIAIETGLNVNQIVSFANRNGIRKKVKHGKAKI